MRHLFYSAVSIGLLIAVVVAYSNADVVTTRAQTKIAEIDHNIALLQRPLEEQEQFKATLHERCAGKQPLEAEQCKALVVEQMTASVAAEIERLQKERKVYERLSNA